MKHMLTTEIDTYLDDMLAQLCLIFEAYTDGKCSACIKMFLDKDLLHTPRPGAQSSYLPVSGRTSSYIRTVRRDRQSVYERGYVDSQEDLSTYDYHRNAAFVQIMDHRDEPDYFFDNDLPASQAAKKYYNGNPRYHLHYTASAVIPIKKPDRPAFEGVVGFLCVDNKIGSFDDRICKDVLAILSCDLYLLFRGVASLLSYVDTLGGNPMSPATKARIK